MLDLEPYEKAADILKVLAHPHRLAIVHGLATKKCNVSTMQDCLNIPQSTVSSHLKLLRSAKIVTGQRKGTEVTYSVTSQLALDVVRVVMGDAPPAMDPAMDE